MLLEERERGEVTRKQGAKGQSPRHSGLRQEPPETGGREAEMEKPLAGGGGGWGLWFLGFSDLLNPSLSIVIMTLPAIAM